eukprot:TRINITY_DN2336_c0_g1_i1.p1 TRINITY_DN2336_c0_g1~~TRINITY_DN2336_c0_g1_i1.p1  ORF type:complete len:129 (+),score=20.68 TRINITY_DN2336_c0_g1_i1:206-592(+)
MKSNNTLESDVPIKIHGVMPFSYLSFFIEFKELGYMKISAEMMLEECDKMTKAMFGHRGLSSAPKIVKSSHADGKSFFIIQVDSRFASQLWSCLSMCCSMRGNICRITMSKVSSFASSLPLMISEMSG